MKIAIFTLCRERLLYTQEFLRLLALNAGCEYDHFILDNGSTDGTREWLMDEYLPTCGRSIWLTVQPENVGISKASNICVREILDRGVYDLVVKMDNDLAMRHHGTLAAVANIYATCPEAERWVLSPRVVGINRQPRRVRMHELAGHPIGVTAIVGGLFHAVPATIYRHFMGCGGYDETLPKAWGQDDQFADWLARNRYAKGYIEDLEVEHMETTTGQAARYPAYFERKWKEEKA